MAIQPAQGTTFEELLEQFVEEYNRRFQIEDATLQMESLELRNSKNKKMKASDAVAGNILDKEDLYIRPSNSSKPKAKATTSKAFPAVAKAPPVTPARGGTSEPSTAFRSGTEPVHDDMSATACHTQEPDAAADFLQPPPAPVTTSQEHRFRFAQERKAVTIESEDELSAASPVPTEEHIVQCNCIKCHKYMFYKAECSLVSCHACSFLQVVAECYACGTFFTASHEQDHIPCPACPAAGPLTAFADRRKRSFAPPAPAPARGGAGRGAGAVEAHLVVQFYRDSDPERRGEVELCLRRNVGNPLIRHVHVLTEEPMDLTPWQAGDKIVQYVLGHWITYADAVAYANRFLRGRLVILANADIHFDQSLGRLGGADLAGRCLALTRHDAVGEEPVTFKRAVAPISQDAWVFKAPLPETLTNIDFKFGKPGCDNRFAYELRQAGMRVTNPCFSVLVYHRHASEKRSYVHGRDTIQGAYAAVIPILALDS